MILLKEPPAMARPRTDGSRYQRRNHLINPAFQWKYTLTIGIGVFLVATIMALVLFGSLHQQAQARAVTPATSYAWQNATTVIIFAVALSALMVTGLGYWSLILTHRISGPLFVLQRLFNDLSKGIFPKRRPLRNKDEFKEIHDGFWTVVDSLRDRRRSELAILTEALNTARSAATSDDEARKCALGMIAAQIEPLCNEIAASLGEPAPAEQTAGTPAQTQDVFAMADCNV
jgi:hypothetical protein